MRIFVAFVALLCIGATVRATDYGQPVQKVRSQHVQHCPQAVVQRVITRAVVAANDYVQQAQQVARYEVQPIVQEVREIRQIVQPVVHRVYVQPVIQQVRVQPVAIHHAQQMRVQQRQRQRSRAPLLRAAVAPGVVALRLVTGPFRPIVRRDREGR